MQDRASATRSFPRAGYIFLTIAVAAYILMRVVSDGLTSAAIVDFELAKTVERVKALMVNWGGSGDSAMLSSTYADFLFIIGYAGLLFYTSRWAGHLSGSAIFKKAGYFFGWLALLAGICDVLENGSILFTLHNTAIPWMVHFTYDMAVVKFSLLFIVLLFIVICLFFWLIDRMAGQKMRLRIGGSK